MEARERILEEAARLFASKGMDGVSLQEISDAVGMRKPSVLYYYPSKEVLHSKVLEDLLSRWTDVVPTLMKAATQKNAFEAMLAATIEFFSANPDRARLLLREAIDRPDAMRGLVRSHASQWGKALADLIRSAQEDGNVRPDVDPEAYLCAVVQLVIGTFAAGPVLDPILPRGKANAAMNELKRIARVSLVKGKK